MSPLAWFGVGFIRLYQMTLSPDHGPLKHLLRNRTCRFHPTCSEYTEQAIRKYGFFKGSWLGMKRISRCHPWNEGGFDPLP